MHAKYERFAQNFVNTSSQIQCLFYDLTYIYFEINLTIIHSIQDKENTLTETQSTDGSRKDRRRSSRRSKHRHRSRDRSWKDSRLLHNYIKDLYTLT